MHKFLKLGTAVCVLSALILFPFCATSKAEITIGGKSLGSIPDIIKATTGSDLPEIQKHSLLLYERVRNGSGMRYQSYVLTINSDGSLRKRFGGFVDNDSSYLPMSTSTGVVQKIDLAISDKRFGRRRNVVYTTSGLSIASDGRYGYQTIESNGTEDSADISSPSHDYFWQDQHQMWGIANLQVSGIEDKDVFVMAHTDKMDTTGSLYFRFFTCDRNGTGKVSGLNLLRAEGGDSGNTYDSYLGWKVWGYGHGVLGCEIATGDIDRDGYKNEIALTWTQNGGSW